MGRSARETTRGQAVVSAGGIHIAKSRREHRACQDLSELLAELPAYHSELMAGGSTVLLRTRHRPSAYAYSFTVTFIRMASSGLSRSSRGSFAIMSMISIPRMISPKME